MNCRWISHISPRSNESLWTAEASRTVKLCLFAVACLVMGTMAVPAAAQDEEKKERIKEERTVTTDDEWPIHITYYNFNPGPNAPVVVMLHMQGSNRQVYEQGLAEKVAGTGIAVVTVDLRKHGESKSRGGVLAGDDSSTDVSEFKPIDYAMMVAEDLEAVKRFLFEEHQFQNLNMAKMGILAAEMSAPVAVNFASRDWLKKPYDDAPTLNASTPRGQDVKALALLSPTNSVPGLQTFKPLKLLAAPQIPIALMVGVGTGDALDKGDAKKIYQAMAGNSRNKGRTYLETYQFKLRGTDLLGKNLLVEDHVVAFFNKHLGELEIDWVDRRPRYDRDKKNK
ncbi:MAG: hypothetical protein O2955_17200 [Planctomycetota bacterium]|nr:hypothetical protein [Planctomycetota bacterium]MDA1214248.1 hypothetical protein [Planctomycetota bacterium]